MNLPHARTRFTTDRLVQVERPAKKMRGARTRATTPRLQPRTYAHLLGLIWQTGHAAAVDSVSARRVWPGLAGSSNEAAGLEHMKIKLPDQIPMAGEPSHMSIASLAQLVRA